MTDSETRRIETFIRMRQFGTDNTADFPVGTVGGVQFVEVGAVIGEAEALAGDQSAGRGQSRQDFVTKDTARENLREAIYDISRTARSMRYQFDGIEAKFRMPENRSDQVMLATARAFHEESAAYDTDFQTYELDKNFRADLLIDIEVFEDSLDPTGSAIDEHVAATAELSAVIRRGMIARRILDGVVKNKYRSDVGKLAAWLSASHIEKAPVKPKPPTT